MSKLTESCQQVKVGNRRVCMIDKLIVGAMMQDNFFKTYCFIIKITDYQPIFGTATNRMFDLSGGNDRMNKEDMQKYFLRVM